ncbi:toll/interleukin-1 receptor domain-containing protein [Bradyrhizobium japonicum]|uniref:toll/interleukin-1 receptor domain-containing protein n=1 Tax=Bradyrhizobium japonicum TaxID=375 RepID=UPI001BA5C4B2|nr:toll/interleukin-1 receptor domain-containing protein [Bradyrhizobium japonicum]MBR0958659.1 toll/interleukin-1 receptor domain-containing protein [Bradyrhizobium japonicum]
MADIFFSYAKVDRAQIEPIIHALETEWTVWWDDDLQIARSFSEEIEEELNRASCTIVAWSKASTKSKYVLDEAGLANEAGKLVPISLDSAKPPLGFRGIQTGDFSKWQGERNAPEFMKLRQAVQLRVGVQPAPAKPTSSPANELPGSTSSTPLQERQPGDEPEPSKPGSGGGKPGSFQGWLIALAIVMTASVAAVIVMANWPQAGRPSPDVTPTPSRAAASTATAFNGIAIYLHTKRPQQQIDDLSAKLREAGFEQFHSDGDVDNDNKPDSVSPRSGVDYRAGDAKSLAAATKAAQITNELLGTGIKPRPQTMEANKLGIWLPYRGDYTASLVFAGDFNRDRDIRPFAREVGALGWKWQEPTAGGGARNEAAARMCEVRYGSPSDRPYAELLAKDISGIAAPAGATRVAPGGVSVKVDSSVAASSLQIWIGSGICK